MPFLMYSIGIQASLITTSPHKNVNSLKIPIPLRQKQTLVDLHDTEFDFRLDFDTMPRLALVIPLRWPASSPSQVR